MKRQQPARTSHPVIVEKDYWVCWTLGRVFALSDIADSLVFKGGTSLSKVFHVIGRFSEDIDLSVCPAILGLSDDEPAPSASKTSVSKTFELMQTKCGLFVNEDIRSVLEESIANELGSHDDEGTWLEYAIEGKTSHTLLFRYPSALAQEIGYIEPRIKLEFGSLTGQRPHARHKIVSMLFEALPGLETENRVGPLLLKWSAPSGRKQPFCMPNIIGRKTSLYQIAMLGTTLTLLRYGIIHPMKLRCRDSTSLTSSPSLSHVTSEPAGQTMSRPDRAHYASVQSKNGSKS